MLEDAGYRKWGKAFSPDSHYEGEWKGGAYIKFVDWNIGGTKALLKEVRPYERIVYEHVSLINTDGREDTAGAVAKSWIGCSEIYCLKETKEGEIKLAIEITVSDTENFITMFDNSWPQALEMLKGLCEG